MAARPSPATPFSIRRAVAADFDAYMDAFESVAAEGRWMGAEAPIDRTGRRAGFERSVGGDDSVAFLAEAGGRIVGAGYAGLSGGIAELGMFVVGGHRGGGVGRALLEAVIDWARAAGAHKVSLAAWPTNHPALGLYARYGFRVEGTRRRHYRRRSGALWDSVVMGLVLDVASEGGPVSPAPPWPPRPAIVVPDGGILGGGVGLREWHRSDGPALVGLVDDPDNRRWLPQLPDPYAPADADEYIARSRVGLTEGTAAGLAIVVSARVVGSIELRVGGDQTGDIGYWVGAAARGRGVATAATRLLCDFAFASLGLRRIELNAAVGNVASRRVAEKAGFELEGVRRGWQVVAGVPTDFALYGRVASPA
jgi:RimJ/RimL family protein N-acetyltransferase